MSTTCVWSPGQRALLRFLEREGLLRALPDPPAGEAAPTDELLFAAIADTVAPAVLAERIASRLHLPLLEAHDVVDPAAGALLTASVATRCGAIPVGLQGDLLEVATANPLDLDTVKTIEFASGRRVRVLVATPDTVRRMLVRLYGGEEPAAAEEPPAPPLAPPPGSDAPVALADDPAHTTPVPRRQRLLLLVADPSARDRLASALHDADPDWLVVTAQDVGEASALAALTRPDVVLVDSTVPAGDLDVVRMAPVVRVVAGDHCDDLQELIARTRTVINTAHHG